MVEVTIVTAKPSASKPTPQTADSAETSVLLETYAGAAIATTLTITTALRLVTEYSLTFTEIPKTADNVEMPARRACHAS